MTDRAVNRCAPGELSEADVTAALVRIEARDADRASEASHVLGALTWGEGVGQLTQAVVQNWLWYQLPTKYFTDEVDYMARLAGIAAELFDELTLDGYAAVCRSAATAGVHAAYERSDEAGIEAMREASEASGIEPPGTDEFEWGDVMGLEEANARSNSELMLERAIAGGELVVGGRAWRAHQREIVSSALDADHPSQPGQTWRTAVLTERLATWVGEPSLRSDVLAGLRGRVVNDLLHAVAPPDDLSDRLEPLTWFLEVFGAEQALTQAGYLNTSFLRRVHVDKPWTERFASDAPPRSESDSITLHRLRSLLQRVGALRKSRGVLRRTSTGALMASNPVVAWDAFVGRSVAQGWDRFAIETIGLVLLDHDAPTSAQGVREQAADVATELGWRTSGDGGTSRDPTPRDVSWAIGETLFMLELFGMLLEDGDWGDRQWLLTPSGRSTVLAMLRATATGPSSRPW